MNVWRPYTPIGTNPQKKILRARDAYLYLEGGEVVFDGISSWWLITHGHCHPEIMSAIAQQTEKLDQVIFANFTHDAAELLVERLEPLLPPTLNSLFFSDNGSTAVEVAMKMAYQWTRLAGDFKKNKFCAFKNSYHGDTFGAMSVGADGLFTKPYEGLRLDVIHCDQGELSTDPLDKWTADFKEKLARHHEEILAVIFEPFIQGAAGMIVWPKDAVEEIAKLCQEYDVLLIFDEVMTGFGRTGKMFAFEHLSVVPDLVCLSKGLTGGSLPLALTLTSEKIYERFRHGGSQNTLFHGHSFTANPIACAAAAASLKLFSHPQALRQIQSIEETHWRSLLKLSQKFDLKDHRALGVVGALELRESISYGSSRSQQIYETCLNKGLFLRPLGSVIYLLPPHCSTTAEIEWAWDVVSETLDELSIHSGNTSVSK